MCILLTSRALPKNCSCRRRESRTRDGSTEIHPAPRHRGREIDAALVVLRTPELRVQHVRRLRNRLRARGSGFDGPDHVGIDRHVDRLRPEPVSERRRMRGDGRRRFRVPVPVDARWPGLFGPDGRQG